jgi:TrpR-related protein YerC/YecD
MKANRSPALPASNAAEQSLYEAVLTLTSLAECQAFFHDLCTPAELQAMADRWAVVDPLRRGMPYREIHRQTGVSVTTIGRVARCLALGDGGYTTAASRIEAQRG